MKGSGRSFYRRPWRGGGGGGVHRRGALATAMMAHSGGKRKIEFNLFL
jgi:hypothetical protein